MRKRRLEWLIMTTGKPEGLAGDARAAIVTFLS